MAATASLLNPLAKLVLACITAAVLAAGAQARDGTVAPRVWRSEDLIALSDLPAQGQRTYQAILDGGPFPHEKDGSVFGNRERLLPREARGHYREYTVETPGRRDRGARRIVCAGKQPTAPSACWYTADHYASFRRIAP